MNAHKLMVGAGMIKSERPEGDALCGATGLPKSWAVPPLDLDIHGEAG